MKFPENEFLFFFIQTVLIYSDIFPDSATSSQLFIF